MEDHPEAVMDASLMAGLNQMAVKLVEESVHLEDSPVGAASMSAKIAQFQNSSSSFYAQKSHSVTSTTNNRPKSAGGRNSRVSGNSFVL